MSLTEAQTERFRRDGFLGVEQLLTPEEVETLRRRFEAIARGEVATLSMEVSMKARGG